MKARALMYHDVDWGDDGAGGFEGSGPDVYTVTGRRFAEHLDRIESLLGRAPETAAALESGRAPDGSWLLTFDDGGESAARAGAELARRSWPAHFFIVTDLVGTPGFAGWDEIRALADQGHVIGSHSCTHPSRMSACSWEQLLDEWSRSVELLSERLGTRVSTASVPGGYYSTDVGRAAVAAGISTLFTSEPVQAVGSVDGCRLIGRYAVRRDTTAGEAASAAAGQARPWLRQRASWELRGLAKRLGGSRYESLRAALLARRRAGADG